jgi:hypothetical protein
MKKLRYFSLILFLTFIIGGCKDSLAQKIVTGPKGKNDLSDIRGFNYTPANDDSKRHHIDCWLNYDDVTTDFDLNLAKSLDLNQVRFMLPYQVYLESKDKNQLKGNLQKFVQACNKRGIGVMLCVGSGKWINDTTLRSQGREWAKFLVDALSGQPGLKFWDVMNEPDYPPTPAKLIQSKCDNAKFMSKVFHELDHKTPVTIGFAFLEKMMELANYVDVLQFHDYSQTREKIRNNILRSKHFADSVGKPLINGEIGCIARANPYDVTLEEHMKAGVGWYIWELMIVRKGWGNVHGVFYEDGTVRDPSIAAAIMGFFRKRSSDVLLAVPDREGKVSEVVNKGNAWLRKSDASWIEGLMLTETAANLLESAELVPMRIPPTSEVNRLREGGINMPALKELLTKYIGILQPYMIAKK